MVPSPATPAATRETRQDISPVPSRRSALPLRPSGAAARQPGQRASHTYAAKTPCLDPSTLYTLRLWSGLPTLQVRRPGNCRYPLNCPLDDFKSWQRNRCPKRPDCRGTSREALSTERQKLVDTALVADTLHLARHCESDWVAVVSNDDDILPGLLAGAADHGRLLLVTVSRTKPSPYADLLARNSVGYVPLDDRS